MESSQTNGNNGRILIVDDDRFFRSLVVNLLQPYNYQCIEAANGTIAIDMMRGNPSLVIVDFRLPDCDGLSLIGKIKDIKPDVPIIFLSGIRCDAGRLARLRAYNVSAILEKPVDPVNFITVVQEVFRQSKPAEAVVEQATEDNELPAVDYNCFEEETTQPESNYAQEPAPALLAITDRSMYNAPNQTIEPQYFESPIETVHSVDNLPAYAEYVNSRSHESQTDSHPSYETYETSPTTVISPSDYARTNYEPVETQGNRQADFCNPQPSLNADELRTIAESLAQFQREYLTALPNDLIGLSNRINSSGTQMEDIIRTAHTLKGTSGSYGMIEICHIAKRIEDTAARNDLYELKTLSRALLHAAEELQRSSTPNLVKRQPHSLNHVIVVHAHTGFRDRVRGIACRHELECTAVEDAIEAMNCMQTQEVDAVIFGHAPGLEASVAELRRFIEATGRHALVVLAIGYATLSERISAVNNGFDLVIDGVFSERSWASISQKAFPPLPKTVLILGDHTANTDSITRVLSKAGTTVLIESDLTKLAFDSITQDGQVVIVARESKSLSGREGGGDGFDVCRALLACKESSSFSVILMDDEFDPRARRLAVSIGCDDYIFPPMTAETLITRLSRLASHQDNAQQTSCNKRPRKDSSRNRQCSSLITILSRTTELSNSSTALE